MHYFSQKSLIQRSLTSIAISLCHLICVTTAHICTHMKSLNLQGISPMRKINYRHGIFLMTRTAKSGQNTPVQHCTKFEAKHSLSYLALMESIFNFQSFLPKQHYQTPPKQLCAILKLKCEFNWPYHYFQAIRNNFWKIVHLELNSAPLLIWCLKLTILIWTSLFEGIS